MLTDDEISATAGLTLGHAAELVCEMRGCECRIRADGSKTFRREDVYAALLDLDAMAKEFRVRSLN